MPVCVEVLPRASTASKDLLTIKAKAPAAAVAAIPTAAIHLVAPAAAPPIDLRPPVTDLKAAFVLSIAVIGILIFLLAMLPSIFQDF